MRFPTLLCLLIVTTTSTAEAAPVEGPNPPPPALLKRGYTRRAAIGLEFSPGVAIPLKRYLDFGRDQDRYSMDNGAGFGFGLAVTFNRFELRWTYARLSAGPVQGHLPDSVAEPIRTVLGKDINQNISGDVPGPLVMHSLTAGYRLTFEPTPRLEIGIPVGLGLAITTPPAFGLVSYDLFGLAVHVGGLVDYKIGRFFAVGADVRCSFLITEPDPNLAGAGLGATKNIFDNAVAWLPLLSIGLHARLYY